MTMKIPPLDSLYKFFYAVYICLHLENVSMYLTHIQVDEYLISWAK